MTETQTRAKVWLKKDKKLIEVTATDDGLVIDTYNKKKDLIKTYKKTIRYLRFGKHPVVDTKDDLLKSLTSFINEYYSEDEAIEIIHKTQVNLGLTNDNKNNISYIG